MGIVFLLLLLDELAYSFTLLGDCAILSVEIHVLGVTAVLHVPGEGDGFGASRFALGVEAVPDGGCVLAELEEVSSDAIGAGGWLRDLEGRKRLPSTCMSRNIADV